MTRGAQSRVAVADPTGGLLLVYPPLTSGRCETETFGLLSAAAHRATMKCRIHGIPTVWSYRHHTGRRRSPLPNGRPPLGCWQPDGHLEHPEAPDARLVIGPVGQLMMHAVLGAGVPIAHNGLNSKSRIPVHRALFGKEGPTMRAVVVHAPKDLRVEDMTTSARGGLRPAAGQVRVAIETGGICGSDLHYYQHGGFGVVRIQEPMILGHEVAGIVAELGEDVTGLHVGDRVAVNPSRPCGVCRYCQRGAHNHCLDMRFYGSAMRMPHIQGAFRDQLIADAGQCHRVMDSVSAGEAALAEPLAVCLHAVRQAGPLLGQRVLITGSGPIGVLCAIAARRAGALEIVATDIAAPPLAVMKRLAGDTVLNVAENPDALASYSGDKGTFDVMFEASGNAGALVGAFDALRPGATIVQVGLGGDATLPLNVIVAKEFALKGTFRFHEEFGYAVELIGRKLIDVAPLITDTLPVDDAVEAFELAGDRQRAMKVQLAFAGAMP